MGEAHRGGEEIRRPRLNPPASDSRRRSTPVFSQLRRGKSPRQGRIVNSSADQSMPPDPKIPLPAANPNVKDAPTAGPGSAPPVITDSPPKPAGKSPSFRQTVAVLLNLCLGLFLAGGAVSLLDDSLVLFWGQHLLTLFSGTLTFIAMMVMLLVYILMGLTILYFITESTFIAGKIYSCNSVIISLSIC